MSVFDLDAIALIKIGIAIVATTRLAIYLHTISIVLFKLNTLAKIEPDQRVC